VPKLKEKVKKGRALEAIFAADVVGTLASTLKCSGGQFATQHGGFPGGLGSHAAREIPKSIQILQFFGRLKNFALRE